MELSKRFACVLLDVGCWRPTNCNEYIVKFACTYSAIFLGPNRYSPFEAQDVLARDRSISRSNTLYMD